MKDWLETRQVFDRLATWYAAGEPCALATVVGVQGSAYRHDGAKMVVNARGESVGNVSGGCLEADVREVAHGEVFLQHGQDSLFSAPREVPHQPRSRLSKRVTHLPSRQPS